MRDYEDYERGEEIKALGQVAKANLDAILEAYSAETIADLARGAYKYTSCGARSLRLRSGTSARTAMATAR